MSHFDEAQAAVEAALAAGARYADARVLHRRTESMQARDGDVERLERGESAGVGVRALVGSGWGFQAVGELSTAAARRAGSAAAAIARASATLGGPPVDLITTPPRVGSWASGCAVDPATVPLSTKGDLLAGVTAASRAGGADVAEATYQTWDTRSWFVSSEGHRIDQHIRECGAGMSATAVGDSQTQRRSYPSAFGRYGTRGWDLVTELDLPAHAERIAEEARALLTAPLCPAGETTLILGGEQMSLQIHESVGHAIELDRILGWEAAFAGTSWLELGRLGSLRFGAPLMNITIDPTIPGAVGSFGYDDEGSPAIARDAVRDGIWVGVLAGRDSARAAGLDYAGNVRADGFARLPMVRMSNVGLEPGPHTLEEIIAATDDGILMETNRSYSIDDRRLNFQFGTEIGYEVKNGRLGRMLRNPTYTGISPRFWASMDMLSSEIVPYGLPICGKGQPLQLARPGHPAAPARFRNVRVGVRG
ncbi:TldD/PmbA family protein [Jidongwangia harbinensis]|uniref:TldD/PmbA family protein n=1 Tax=Jidongwangia harbinensis TaxID=2878561 RepID=UPI001CD9BD4E|nr:TldD/PmbA family protein [Jidongwangia harbinensis]MCA2211826.1 TldD/PmbA family protein [Jidongwangia harbinensis]